MERINEYNNKKAINNLKKGLDTSWDIFLYGDKASGTKPGNIQVYGTIAGQREVLKERVAMQEKFNDFENDL